MSLQLQPFEEHINKAIKQLKAWSRRPCHPAYPKMAEILTKNIIPGLIEHLNNYCATGTRKLYPHFDYITGFGNEATILLLAVRDEMLNAVDVEMGPPGLRKPVKYKVNRALQCLSVLGGKVRRQQKSCGNVKLYSLERRTPWNVEVDLLAEIYWETDAHYPPNLMVRK